MYSKSFYKLYNTFSLMDVLISMGQIMYDQGFPCGSAGKESACNAGDLGLIPGLGRSPGEWKGYPLQYSGLENSTDCKVLGVAKSRTGLSNFDFHFYTQYILCKIKHMYEYILIRQIIKCTKYMAVGLFRIYLCEVLAQHMIIMFHCSRVIFQETV